MNLLKPVLGAVLVGLLSVTSANAGDVLDKNVK